MTETIAFRMLLKPGQREEYQRRHREIWPELIDRLRDAGISNYWIFLDPTNDHLFAVLARRDDHKMDELEHDSVMRKWWGYMADIMYTEADGAPAQQQLAPMFHLP